jgi:hypothetical protein
MNSVAFYALRSKVRYVYPPKVELFAVGGFTLRRLSCTVGGCALR